MKKAKIALTAIALFAVIGGALAFKASRIQFTLWTHGTATTTTVLNGTTYYICSLLASYNTTDAVAAPTSLYYQATFAAAGKTLCVNPITTRGTIAE